MGLMDASPKSYPFISSINAQDQSSCRPENVDTPVSPNDCSSSPAMTGVDVTGSLDSCGFGGLGPSGCGKDA